MRLFFGNVYFSCFGSLVSVAYVICHHQSAKMPCDVAVFRMEKICSCSNAILWTVNSPPHAPHGKPDQTNGHAIHGGKWALELHNKSITTKIHYTRAATSIRLIEVYSSDCIYCRSFPCSPVLTICGYTHCKMMQLASLLMHLVVQLAIYYSSGYNNVCNGKTWVS